MGRNWGNRGASAGEVQQEGLEEKMEMEVVVRRSAAAAAAAAA